VIESDDIEQHRKERGKRGEGGGGTHPDILYFGWIVRADDAEAR